MSDRSHDDAEIAAYYALGLERDRLARGVGALEFMRTRALLERYLPMPPAAIADIGGGPGRYAIWMAERGHRVHLVDPVPLHVEPARVIRFWQPFRDFKHGRDAALRRGESELFGALDPSAPEAGA